VTSTELPGTRRLRCALFVDFDNVYLGLQRLDRVAAEVFATDPGHWLAELGTGTDADGPFSRRFLVRACYLNPSAFAQFRPNFTRAGFQVVDCPSLTQQGKSSADINLVLDALDALSAPTRYEEFVVVSADADFTPLLQRCRADDRRVTIVTASPAASAYRAVADTVVGADAFAELVTTTSALPDDETAVTPTNGALPDEETGVAPTNGAAKKAPAAPAAKSQPASPTGAAAATPEPRGSSVARRAVQQLVRTADRPVPLGAAAQAAQQADPGLSGSGWAGARTFAGWLARELPGLGATTKAPGYVWDPKRFDEADLPGATPAATGDLQRQVAAVTDVPGLTQADYRTLLESLAADVAGHQFDRAETARRVRDTCQAAGAKVGRASVNFVIGGLLYAGIALAGKPAAARLASAWADNVVGLCRGARMELSKDDERAIRAWVGGGLA
jgi:hypothetical protein